MAESSFAKKENSTKNIENNVDDKSVEEVLDVLVGQYFLIDVCANLTNKKFIRDVDGVIQRAKDAGVKKIIVPTSIQNSKEALRLTCLFPNYVYCTAGIHPHDARFYDDTVLNTLKETASNPECVAVGLCGLDFNKTISDPTQQKKVFEIQLSLAVEMQKPVFLYEKDAYADVIGILNNYKNNLPAVVIHSFSGNKEQLQMYLSLGCYIGLTGAVLKDKTEDGIMKILEDRLIPLDKLIVSSDSPFIYPNTRANHIPAHVKNLLTGKSLSYLLKYCTFQRNEPCCLPVIVEIIAAYYESKPDDIALKTSFSALKIFGLC